MLDNVYFRDQICDDWKSSRFPIPENIRKGRNLAIIIGFVEMVCCLLSVNFFVRRRTVFLIMILFFTVLATAAGFKAKLELEYWAMLAHAAYSISVVGAFYIYIFIDALVVDTVKNDLQGNPIEESMSDTVVLIVSSIPLFGLFIMGIISLYIVIQIDDELETRRKVEKKQEGRAEGQQDREEALR